MQLRRLASFIIGLGWLSCATAQSFLSGTLTDSATLDPLPFVAVTLADQANPDIPVAYIYSDDAGLYKLTVPKSSGAYLLTAYAMGYRKASRLVYLQEAGASQITADFALVPQSTELSQATVTAAAPILVRGDTTIYDIEHFVETRDVTLEDVLDRIPGIKILPDGNIRVDGRTVDKVLLQGKELSGGGAALLTRGISAQDVAKVEVRFDEQDAKLKESLLDSRELVVLDIQLKGSVNQSFFGRVAATLDYGDRPGLSPGGNANVFSLSPKLNLQAFGESDRFGAQQISLKDLDNIGREAYAAQFELPADFATLTQREGYQDELYGFRDFVTRDYHVVGLSAQLDLDSATTLYAGTFNAYDGATRASATAQTFLEGPDFGFAEANRLGLLGSKNKLELKTTTKQLRWNTDLNAVYTDGDTRTSFRIDGADNRFRDDFTELDFYANSLLELREKRAAGLSLRLGYADEAQRSNARVELPSAALRDAYGTLIGAEARGVQQSRDVRLRTINGALNARLLTKLGPVRPGLRYQGRSLSATKVGASTGEPQPIPVLSVGATDRVAHQLTPHLAYDFELAGWGASVDAGYALSRYPTNDGDDTRVRRAWELKSSVDGNVGQVNVSASYSRSLGAFPLYQTVPGFDILGLQSLAAAGNPSLRPQLQSVASVSADLKLGSATNISSAVLFGRNRESGRFDPTFAPLAVQRYDQLRASYVLVSNAIDLRPKAWPARITLEPEWLANRQEVRAPGDEAGYTTLSRRTLMIVKLPNLIASKRKYFAYAKYSNFRFLLDESKVPLGRLEFLSFQLSPKLDVAKQWLQLDPSLRLVHFLGSAASTNMLLDLHAQHPGKCFDVSLTATNLLDNDGFRRKELTPLFLSTELAELFGRAVQAELRYRF